VGFDDILRAATNNPPLTTVRQPLQEMGRAAASTLLQMINNERQAWPKHPIRVLPMFVERQSTATVRQDRKSAPGPVLSVSAFTQR
jgi:DNA-binding LacI/PurR family transcriptional regulator